MRLLQCSWLIAVASLATAAPTARADDLPPPPSHPTRLTRADLPARLADPDTADGRLDGDLGLVVGVGATFRAESPRIVADVRLRYLETAGVFFDYEDGFAATAPGPDRIVVAGLEMRPLFLARWVTGADLGITWPDLVIDSLGLEAGACFEQPLGADFASRPGLQLSLGLELPLLSKVNGPWIGLHGGGRWSDAVLMAGGTTMRGDSEAFLSVTLAWHHLFATHLVDLNDTAP